LTAVNCELPLISIIIPAPPGQTEVLSANAARQLDYPKERLEILIARGRQPSVQRNTALRAARGELVYFLDDDALPDAANLRRMAERFADPKVVMLGGPNLCPPDAPALEQVFALVLSAVLAFGPSRARYTRVGGVRATSEKELILCNLSARREPVLARGGFDETLYPNEENALMDALQQHGGTLLYDPEFVALRRPRRTLQSFARMLMTYGRGRAEQFRQHPTPGSALNFVPPLFCLYLLTLPWLLALTPMGAGALGPLALYALAVLVQTVALVPQGGVVRAGSALPLIVASHLLYGLGFWRGLFTTLRKPGQRGEVPVTLETLDP
jgi:hypothetical protein